MAELCQRCKENSVAHRRVRIRINQERQREGATDLTPNMRTTFLDICHPCWEDLLYKAKRAWNEFRGPE